ncbi:Holliday junction branch migration protein RuvA [Marinitenerispora sediminis]|uniref:Holliday junction branch migration complex subunit RuvA n=1 Tax=Marinitenerispora sediminis TaxID=1931232 RepID=A0A368T7S2_9ACTN|nr:Holliday junction branch migration protein RuvA [Marinitenerispora sediminis]RCV51029.1 Holliday junction branch migration protein RuvA [Marinitenerispora sediminis]RCV57022.1 Holliday junction branch migration protein RuvA [Marinitenerispora sediminis]RCV60014.1 Holliday junction branch migration protein RuvA [Marinitenerispora sediminis]
MIASLSGRVAARSAGSAVIEVGGVGMAVQCTPATLSRLRVGEPATVATSLVVREESLTLYGFADADERDVFERLQTAGGVGPRLALAMLAVHTPDALRRAVATEDTGALTRVPGIGKKGAQRIVLELRDKLGAAAGEPQAEGAQPAPAPVAWRPQVVSGLVNLGWSSRDAERAADAVAGEADGEADVAVLLRSALRKLSRA